MNLKHRAFISNIFNEVQEDLLVEISEISSEIDRKKPKENSSSYYKCSYTPVKPGIFSLNVLVGDVHVGGSPFELKIGIFFITNILIKILQQKQ